MPSEEFKSFMLAHGIDIDAEQRMQEIGNADMDKHRQAKRILKVGQRVWYRPPDGYRPYGIQPGKATVKKLRVSKADICTDDHPGFEFDVHAGYLEPVRPKKVVKA